MQGAPIAVAASTKNARKSHLVDQAFQLKYTLMLVGVGAFISILFGGMMYLVHLDAFRAMNPSDELREQMAHVNRTLLWLMTAVTLGMASAFALFGILITHRVAGPIYVMNQYLGLLAEGRYPAMRPLRKTDELKAFFERLQRAIEVLRKRELDEADVVHRAMQALALDATSPEALRALKSLAELREKKQKAVGNS